MHKERKQVSPEVQAEKTKKLAVAATAAGVLLMLFLIVVLIIQFVQIGVRNAEKSRLEEQIRYLEQLNENQRDDLEYYQTELGLYQLALEAGWKNKS